MIDPALCLHGTEHYVHVTLGAAVCALPIALVVGVRLFGEVQLRSRSGAPARDDVQLDQHVVIAERNRYAAWDFHTLLGLGAPACSSWLLLSVPNKSRRVPLALRVGRCLAVAPVGAVFRLPAAAYRERPRALVGVFDARHLASSTPGTLGLSCDPSQLLSDRELDESSSRIESFRSPA